MPGLGLGEDDRADPPGALTGGDDPSTRTWAGNERTYQKRTPPTMSAPMTKSPTNSRRSSAPIRSRISSITSPLRVTNQHRRLGRCRRLAEEGMANQRAPQTGGGKPRETETYGPSGRYQPSRGMSVNYVTPPGESPGSPGGEP